MFTKILVPLDGSPLAERALPIAVGLAKLTGGTITLVHAVEASGLPGTDKTDAEVEVVRKGEAYVEGVEQRLRSEGVNVRSAVWYGPPVFAITEAARIGGTDVIVMSTHGRGGLGRLVLGSVADAVIRRTRVPVLLVREPEAPLEEPLPGPAAVPRSPEGA